MNDTHEEKYPDIGLYAGIQDLKVTLQSPFYTLLIDLKITVPLHDKRGAHMSRLIVPELVKHQDVEHFIKKIKEEVFKSTGEYPMITASFQFPWRDQFALVEVWNNISIRNNYTLTLQGITACPCSKETCGVGHMQKCSLTIETLPNRTIRFEEYFELMEKCFSASLNEKLKRPEEAAKILEAQGNPKFVEDVARNAISIIPDLLRLEVISDESIHNHKAVATWQK